MPLKSDAEAFPKIAYIDKPDPNNGIQSVIYETNGLTARQYAAIQLRVPDSGEPWLDKMIKKSRVCDATEALISCDVTGRHYRDLMSTLNKSIYGKSPDAKP